MLRWLVGHGTIALLDQRDGRTPGSALFGTKVVMCEIGTFWYHCSGLPFQLYIIVLLASLVLLVLYIISCIFVLFWMIFPCFGMLSYVMENFKMNFKRLDDDDSEDQHEFQGFTKSHQAGGGV